MNERQQELNELTVVLRRATPKDADELDAAFKRSAEFHQPWTYPPKDIEKYTNQPHLYLVCVKETDEIAGTFNISQIVRYRFQSAYLGYNAFVPYHGKGYMRQGIRLLLREAFENLGLHRLEANIQPGNRASIALVLGAGFNKEGYSPKYLRVGDEEWKDHERWAIINERWVEHEDAG